MARQIIDLNEINREDLSPNDLLVVRDLDQKKDKKLKVGTLITALDIAQKLEELSTDADYVINKVGDDITIKQYRKPFVGYSKYICKTSGSRSTNASATPTAIGVPFDVVNTSDLPIKVIVRSTAMIQKTDGVIRYFIGLNSSNSMAFAVGRGTYNDVSFWRECETHGEITVGANSSVTLRAYMFREGGSSTATVCDAPGDVGAGYGMYVSVSFNGFVEL